MKGPCVTVWKRWSLLVHSSLPPRFQILSLCSLSLYLSLTRTEKHKNQKRKAWRWWLCSVGTLISSMKSGLSFYCTSWVYPPISWLLRCLKLSLSLVSEAFCSFLKLFVNLYGFFFWSFFLKLCKFYSKISKTASLLFLVRDGIYERTVILNLNLSDDKEVFFFPYFCVCAEDMFLVDYGFWNRI